MVNCQPPCTSLGLAGCTQTDANGVCLAFTADTPASSSWLQNLIGGAVTTVEDIFKAKNTVRGVLTQTSPGVFQYVQPTGSNVTLPVNVSPAGALGVNASASSGMGMILIAGAGLFLVFMLAKGKN